MKKVLSTLFVAAAMLLTVSCGTGNFASSGGNSNMAYLTLISSSDLAGKEVTVKVDDDTPFTAKVQKDKQDQAKIKGKLYGIKPGKCHVEVYYNGQPVYSQDIFVSTQNTKVINL